MEVSEIDLNVRFIRNLLADVISDYQKRREIADNQKDKVDLIHGLLDILEDEDLLKNEQHSLTYNYKKLIDDTDKIEHYLFSLDASHVIDFPNSKIRHICEKIKRCATICYNWQNNVPNMVSSDFRAAKRELTSILNMFRDISKEEESRYRIVRPPFSEKIIEECKTIKDNLYTWKPIESDQYRTLKIVFSVKGFSERQTILLLEAIRKHNIECHKKEKNEFVDFTQANETVDMLTSGYEYIRIPDVESDRKDAIDFYCKIIDKVIKESNSNSSSTSVHILEYLPRYEGNLVFSDNYSKEEFDYFVLSLLKQIQDNLYLYASYMSNEFVYKDKFERNDVRADYYKYLKVYLLVRDYYDKQVKEYEKVEEIDDNSVDSMPDVYKFSFTSRGYEHEKTYFESDLKSVSKDLYSRITKHLTYFKKNMLPKSYFKSLGELGNGFYEIKDDQVRIVYRHIKENEYAIMGVFVKKDDNDRVMYRKLSGRDTGVLLTGEDIEKQLFNLLDTKKHSGGRKNS